MKKNYVRPSIVFDSFELAENIAACELISTPQGRYDCAVLDTESGLTIFNDPLNGCKTTPLPGEDFCYEVPFEGFNVFMS